MTLRRSRPLRALLLTLLVVWWPPRPAPADPVVGAWSDVLDWPIVAIHMVQLHTGEILIWSSKHPNPEINQEAHVLDPTGDCFEGLDCFTEKPNPVNIFCGGHAHLDDGSILVNGGHVVNDVGEAETFLFQYDRETKDWNWTDVGEIEDTHHARWYPTLTTLPDGRVLNVSGSQLRCNDGDAAAPLCREDDDCAVGGCGTYLVAPPELFDPADRTWRLLSLIDESVQYYPFNFVDPDGNVFFAGADSGASGHDFPSNQSGVFDLETELLTEGPMSTIDGGSAVMYEPGKILKSGGTDGDGTIRDAEIIDLNGGGGWAPTGLMNIPRRRHNLTVLPDGTVLATGGTRLGNREFEVDRTCGGTDDGGSCGRHSDCPEGVQCLVHQMGEQQWVAEAEIWDPENPAGTWTVLAGAQRPRMYHSTAILLPDGRVLSAGGGRGGGAVHEYSDAEIFSPPYLFIEGEDPPVIDEAPEIIHYGEVFEVLSPQAAEIGRVSLIRLAAVTHSFDQNRRFVPLTFATSGDVGLAIDAPPGPEVAPPGYYMLFLVSDAGVPSVARFVRLLPADPGAGALYEYSAKVVCGTPGPDDALRHAPGLYTTSVNVHNPGAGTARFYKKLALTFPPGDQRAGRIHPLGVDALGYDEALQTDCRELRRKAIATGEAPFIEGFVVIQSRRRLDVTAVYATAALDGNGVPGGHSSIDVEPVAERARYLDLEVTKRADHFCWAFTDLWRFCFVLYEVGVANHGPNDAHDLVIEDRATRPGGLLAVVPDLFEISPAGTVDVVTAVGETVEVTATIPELVAGDSAVFRFWVLAPLYTPVGPIVDPAFLEAVAPFLPTTLVNRTTAQAGEPDPATGDNAAEVVTDLP